MKNPFKVKRKLEDMPEISVIRAALLKPGDVVVMSTFTRLSMDYMERVTELMKGYFPNNKVIIMESGATLSIISQDEAGHGKTNGDSHPNNPLPVSQPELTEADADTRQ